jgi:hypothetical protein
VGPPREQQLTDLRENRFRIRAQRFLLTYSNLPEEFDWDALGPSIKALSEKSKYVVVSREIAPTTGLPHAHVFIDFGLTYIVNSPDEFDYDNHHPNIEGIRVTPHKAADYVKKDGDIIYEWGTPPDKPKSKETKDDIWKGIMDKVTTADEFIERALKRAPRDTILHFSQIQAFAQHRYGDKAPEYDGADVTPHYDRYPQLKSWVEDQLHAEREPGERPTNLCLYGETRTGKTTWARSLGRHTYFAALFDLRTLDEDADYMVLDDLVDGFKTLPEWKFWMGGQLEAVINDKYCKKKRVRWGKPCIFLANDDPRDALNEGDRRWVEANCMFVHVPSRDAFVCTPKRRTIASPSTSASVIPDSQSEPSVYTTRDSTPL